MIRAVVYVAFLCAISLSVFGGTSQIAQAQATPTPTPPFSKGEVDRPPTDKTANPKPLASKDGEIVNVETTLVTAAVSVLDRNGRFVSGLTQKDFKVFENDVLQKVAYFRSEEQPFTVVLLIDISPSTNYKIDEIYHAARTFVNQLRDNDKVMVIAFDSHVHPLTEGAISDRQKILASIDKGQFGSGTSLYEAVNCIANLDIIKAPGRKAVVIFTDGVDTTSLTASYQSTIAAVEEVDTLIYPIRYNTLPDDNTSNTIPKRVADLITKTNNPRYLAILRGRSPAEYEKGKTYLEALAQNSGGRMFEARLSHTSRHLSRALLKNSGSDIPSAITRKKLAILANGEELRSTLPRRTRSFEPERGT